MDDDASEGAGSMTTTAAMAPLTKPIRLRTIAVIAAEIRRAVAGEETR